MGLFRKAGWKVIAYPVGYQAPPETHWTLTFKLQEGLRYWWRSTREWAALANHYLHGDSDTFFPAP